MPLATQNNSTRSLIAPPLFRSKQYQVYKAFTYLRHQVRQIDRIITLDVSLHDLIYFAVQTPNFGLSTRHRLPIPWLYTDCRSVPDPRPADALTRGQIM